jgi:uncharacterized protein YcbK (DUF882 family)
MLTGLSTVQSASMCTVYLGKVHRRQFLNTLLAAAPALGMPHLGFLPPTTRVLAFRHLHTSERLEVVYAREGRYIPDALASVNHLLRDFRSGQTHPIDPQLLDVLHALKVATGSREPFEVISGYRSPATNQQLRDRSQGVASGSLHMQGKAIDIRLADVPLAKLREAAKALRRGGVGYYEESNFVHVDTGRVRAW